MILELRRFAHWANHDSRVETFCSLGKSWF